MAQQDSYQQQPIGAYEGLHTPYDTPQMHYMHIALDAEIPPEKLANYDGSVALKYPDESIAFCHLEKGVLQGGYIRYERAAPYSCFLLGKEAAEAQSKLAYLADPMVRGQFKDGLPTGLWKFNFLWRVLPTVREITWLKYDERGRIIEPRRHVLKLNEDGNMLSDMDELTAPDVQRFFKEFTLPKKIATQQSKAPLDMLRIREE